MAGQAMLDSRPDGHRGQSAVAESSQPTHKTHLLPLSPFFYDAYAAAWLDGDRKADPAVYGETSGTWYFLLSGYEYALASVGFGGSGYTAIPADYDGDAKADPAVYEQASGQWYILHSNNDYSPVIITLGGSGYWPVPGEYDGAGAAAPAVYQESSGIWRVLLPSSDYNEVSMVFGGDSFAPVNMCR